MELEQRALKSRREGKVCNAAKLTCGIYLH
jgi:hypothetical protein